MTSTTTCPSTESSTRTRWSFTPPRSFLALNTCTGDNTRSSSSSELLKDNDYDDDDCISNLDCWTWDQNIKQLVQTTYSVSGPETCQHIAGWAWCVLPSVIIMMIMIVIVTTIMIVIILPSVMMMIMHRWWYHDAAAATHWSTNMIITFSPGHVRISDLGLACDFRFSLKIFTIIKFTKNVVIYTISFVDLLPIVKSFSKKRPHASVGTHGYMAPEVRNIQHSESISHYWNQQIVSTINKSIIILINQSLFCFFAFFRPSSNFSKGAK